MADLIWALVGLIAVSLLLYAVATVVFGPGEPTPPNPEVLTRALPRDGALTGSDVRQVELPVVVRGYRMRDVDALLERLAQELDQRDPFSRSAVSNEPVAEPSTDPIRLVEPSSAQPVGDSATGDPSAEPDDRRDTSS